MPKAQVKAVFLILVTAAIQNNEHKVRLSIKCKLCSVFGRQFSAILRRIFECLHFKLIALAVASTLLDQFDIAEAGVEQDLFQTFRRE